MPKLIIKVENGIVMSIDTHLYARPVRSRSNPTGINGANLTLLT